MKKTFLEQHKESIEKLGFWHETYKSVAIKLLEENLASDISEQFYISDIFMHDDKLLIKFSKKIQL